MKSLKGGCNIYFAPVASELIASGGIPDDCKLIYLSDATVHLLMNYYYDLSTHDYFIWNSWEQKAIDRANTILYSSDWAKNDAISYYKADREKVFVAPFGANLSDQYKGKIRMPGLIRLLLVGVEWKRKGIDLAIDCVKILNENNTKWNFELTIIGFSKPRDMEDESIKFAGRLNKSISKELEQIVYYYDNADVFILPTKAECAGIVFSEACMYGLPIFTHDTGGIANYVENGYNGERLKLGATADDFATAILLMLKNNNLEKYSANARAKYNKELNWDVWLDEFCKVVDKLQL